MLKIEKRGGSNLEVSCHILSSEIWFFYVPTIPIDFCIKKMFSVKRDNQFHFPRATYNIYRVMLEIQIIL